MTDRTQPKARKFTMSQYASKDDMIGAMRKRIAELEAELEAVGAGGVQALSAAPAIAKLRHLYQNMVNGAVRDTASAKRIAEGLLAPAIEALERATPPAEQQHTDDMAVDCFARALKAKLAAARAKGRGGWDTPECTQQRLSDMLREHVAKGDPRDVANFCMFLWARGEAIAPPAEQQAPRCSYCDGTGDVHGIDGEWRGICTECDAARAVLAKWGTQPQAGAVPLTDAQIAEMMRDTWGCASIAPRHALEFARSVERAHGITQKGGLDDKQWRDAAFRYLGLQA